MTLFADGVDFSVGSYRGTDNYASSSHNHDGTYVKGNYTITKSNGNFYIS